MKTLYNHFSSEGNMTCCIVETDWFKETVHYKNVRGLTFETFLTKYQKMYNIYSKDEEVMTYDARICFMSKKI